MAPFVTQEHRANPDPSIPGDRCYEFYKEIMDEWRANPRWTTIDELFKPFFKNDKNRAHFLALLVFFVKHGMVYEEAKCLENGDI